MLTNSRAQAERTLELVARGVTPAAQGDEAIAAVASGEATVAAAEADLRRAEEALGPAGANNPQLRAAQSALETAQFNLTPDADRGADARPRHQLQPRAGRDGDRRAAAPDA